ncbi:DNA damage response protein RcaA [Didymella exigua CBS 183.55]|uniref:DNA damage response protein RcaA n=1 Tax=Didymella exigua CBS 183.55 TaxID=1150837 RepID=A0A6A5S2W6_9PLEO|nr:DNA damage response protein RcaA [Didymella exigua CBS 183.55]KAF1933970.1 DNA damage response protein RcaA [Didymella exigua CBS 183.55]
MWFLEHESLFGAKRVWLRPESQQLFGRTKSSEEGKTWRIDNKAVSRQHCTIKVLKVSVDAGSKLHTRSQVEITDLSCRQGTSVDGNMIKSTKNEDGSIEYARTILEGTEHSIRLAQSYEPFKIYWKPLVFTYASKETKESKARSAKLHVLDIKTTVDFIFGKTTHVVTQKRNLPRVLSGLVAGRHIVTSDFLDAVIERATHTTDSEYGYVPSPLEEDFVAQWPKEEEYVPPTATEPVPRPQEMLKPDSTRSEIFHNLTFIFLDPNQHSSLQDPISGGGGKVLLYEKFKHGETTVQEYVDYVRSVAGKKKGSRANNDKLPVITVRLAIPADGSDEWAANFMNGVDHALGQRSMLQNEFLDIILAKDRTGLQKPPEGIPGATSSAPDSATRRSMRDSTPASRAPSQAPESSALTDEPVKPNPRKRIHRPKTTSRFTGFDDYEPLAKIRKMEDTQMEGVQQSIPQSARDATQAPGNQYATALTTQTQARTQRALSPAHEIIEKEELIDAQFPAAAEIKRRRAATRAPSVSVEPETNTPATQPKRRGVDALESLQRARQKADKDINVREQTRLRIKEEEDRRKADEESLREQLEGIDIEQMKNLAVVVEMEVLPRQRNGDNLRTPAQARAQAQAQSKSDRWDPAWNGRKNFKKFRRRGAELGTTPHRVMVALEEAPHQKSFSDSWLLPDIEPRASGLAPRRKKHGEREDDSEPEQGFRGRKSRTHSQRQSPPQQPEVVNVEDSGPDDEEVVEARTQKSSVRTQRVVETQVSEHGRKRPGGAASGQPAAKKGRIDRSRRNDDSDSDEEETGFRFKRR